MKKLLVAAMMALVAGTAFADGAAKKAPAKADPTQMSLAKVKLGGKELTLLVAETDEQRARGLMGIEKMADDNGMIFTYPAPVTKLCMWMKDTKIPLDVAFIDGAGKIVNIETMKPMTTDNHCNTGGPIFFALEMNAGWFEKNNVKPGDSLSN